MTPGQPPRMLGAIRSYAHARLTALIDLCSMLGQAIVGAQMTVTDKRSATGVRFRSLRRAWLQVLVAAWLVCGALLVGVAVDPSDAAAQLSSLPERTFTTDGSVGPLLAVGNTIYVAGSFGAVGVPSGPGVELSRSTGHPPTHLAAVSSFDPRSNGVPDQAVVAVVSDGGGGWYIGGKFTSVGGVARHNLAHILRGGRVDRRFAPKADDVVTALALSGRTLYAGGDFGRVAGERRKYVAAINATDGSVTDWHPAFRAVDGDCADTTCDNPVPIAALAVPAAPSTPAGAFNSVSGRPRHHIAAINTISRQDHRVEPKRGQPSPTRWPCRVDTI